MCDLADSNLSRDRIGGKALAPFDPALCSLLPLHSSYPPRGPWPPVFPPVVPMVVPPTRLHAFVEASFISVGLPVGHYPSEG